MGAVHVQWQFFLLFADDENSLHMVYDVQNCYWLIFYAVYTTTSTQMTEIRGWKKKWMDICLGFMIENDDIGRLMLKINQYTLAIFPFFLLLKVIKSCLMEKYVRYSGIYIILLLFSREKRTTTKPGDNNHWKLGFIVWTRVQPHHVIDQKFDSVFYMYINIIHLLVYYVIHNMIYEGWLNVSNKKENTRQKGWSEEKKIRNRISVHTIAALPLFFAYLIKYYYAFRLACHKQVWAGGKKPRVSSYIRSRGIIFLLFSTSL